MVKRIFTEILRGDNVFNGKNFGTPNRGMNFVEKPKILSKHAFHCFVDQGHVSKSGTGAERKHNGVYVRSQFLGPLVDLRIFLPIAKKKKKNTKQTAGKTSFLKLPGFPNLNFGNRNSAKKWLIMEIVDKFPQIVLLILSIVLLKLGSRCVTAGTSRELYVLINSS